MDYHVTPSTIMGIEAVAGDTIYLSGGTYRGTYAIRSGVRVVGAANSIISGLDVVRDFTHVGSHYTTTVNPLTPLGGSMGADQVFIDGVEVLETRWPTATIETRGDVSTWAEAQGVFDVVNEGTHLMATYEVIGLPPGNLTGCYAHVLNGHQWISIGGVVIDSKDNAVTIRFPSDGKDYNIPTTGSRLYLWGGPLLPGGFHISNGLLYLPTDPGSSIVEVKVRHWGLDLRGSSDVTIVGINLQSCSLRTDSRTTALSLDSMVIRNMIHFQAPTHYWWGPPCIGMRDGGKVTNTKVYHCAGGFADLRGTGCSVDNVILDDMSYTGCSQAGISLQGDSHTISRSTLGMAGASSLIDMRKVTNSMVRGCEVYGGGGILTDGGTIMFARSGVTTDQGNVVSECLIHDTRGRTGPQPYLYGNAGIYVEPNASVTVRDCRMWRATSNDLQVVPLDGDPGHVLVERCTTGSLSISYSGSAAPIPITYRDNIVGVIKGEGGMKAATTNGNYIADRRVEGNTQAPGIFSTLDEGWYPGPQTPEHCGSTGDYYYGAYDTSLIYKPTASRNPVDGTVRVRLEGPPPPDGFTVMVNSTEGVVRQYMGPTSHLMVTLPASVRGEVDLILSAPDHIPRTLGVVVPGNLRLRKSKGMSIQGVGFTTTNQVRVLVTITSMEESWDVPIPIPVGEYIDNELMGADGVGISVREGYPLYVDNTYPMGGTHAWVRVPHIPLGSSTFTLVLGGSANVSNAAAVFLIPDFHLREDLYTKDVVEGISIQVEGTDLVIAGITTTASRYGSVGIKAAHGYLYSNAYPNRPYAWDSYISMGPNSATYWQSSLGNNSFTLCKGGSTISADSNQASTLGKQFSRRLVSNIQLPTSMVWQEDLITINTRDGLPKARGIFNIMVGQVGKAIDYRFHYIRARGVPDSGILPTIEMEVQQSTPRLWVGGTEYTDYLSGATASATDSSSRLLLATQLPLGPGTYDLRVVLDNGEEYTLEGGYEVPSIPKIPTRVTNPVIVREVLHGPLSSRPPTPNPGQVYISHEGTCYAYLGGVWVPYQGVHGLLAPITGTWPRGSILAMVGSGILPTYTLPLAGQELPLSQYESLCEVLGAILGTPLPKTDGNGMEGSTHFLLPHYQVGGITVPGNMGVGFGGWVVHQPGKDYTIRWLVVI